MLLQKGQNQHFQKCLSSARQERTVCCHMERTFYILCNTITVIVFLISLGCVCLVPTTIVIFYLSSMTHCIQVGRLLDLFHAPISIEASKMKLLSIFTSLVATNYWHCVDSSSTFMCLAAKTGMITWSRKQRLPPLMPVTQWADILFGKGVFFPNRLCLGT